MEQAVMTGSTFSAGFPITPPDSCNDLGQRYFGPVVLITDPLCYSATDMFAAGFQDHGIGTVIGVGGATGAGGANVWTHGLLARLMAPPATTGGSPAPGRTPSATTGGSGDSSPYQALPRGADMRVAARRTIRVGLHQGDILEDLGVRPDVRYAMTRRDLMDGNRDLVDGAIDRLAGNVPHPLDVRFDARPGRPPLVVVRSSNLDQVEARLVVVRGDMTEVRSFASGRGHRVELDPEPILGRTAPDSMAVEIDGYDHGRLVAHRRLEVPRTR
jgi:hypothetical protein